MKVKKSWLKSKTLWFNIVVAAMLLAEANLSALQGLIPETLYKLFLFFIPIANMILRVISTKGISFKPEFPEVVPVSTSADTEKRPHKK